MMSTNAKLLELVHGDVGQREYRGLHGGKM